MNQQQGSGNNKDPEEEPVTQSVVDSTVKTGPDRPVAPEPVAVTGEDEVVTSSEKTEDTPMEDDSVNPATVFCIRLKQPRSNLQHKMSVPELCRNFRSELEFNSLSTLRFSSFSFLAFSLRCFVFPFVTSVLLLGVES